MGRQRERLKKEEEERVRKQRDEAERRRRQAEERRRKEHADAQRVEEERNKAEAERKKAQEASAGKTNPPSQTGDSAVPSLEDLLRQLDMEDQAEAADQTKLAKDSLVMQR